MICITETWCSDESVQTNTNFQIPNYQLISFERKTNERGGGIATFIRDNQVFKVRSDLSILDTDSEVFTIEITGNKSKNIIIFTCYRPPEGDITKFSNFLNEIFLKINDKGKNIFFIGDLNINSLNYKENAVTKLFFDNLFQLCILPIINKPTRITPTSVSAIDNILTNTFLESSLKAGIIKTDLLDHFPIYFSLSQDLRTYNNPKTKVYKRKINQFSIKNFKDSLLEVNWDEVYHESNLGHTNSAYNLFINIFLDHYNKHFPVEEKEIKLKYLNCPWITKGIRKSSKTKQKLYIKYLKNRNETNVTTYKEYKNLFEKIRKNSKRVYYSKQLQKSKSDNKKTWNILK
ncbi:uncharacterized protein LOC136083274 [Hydra vulgaris]|uniref:Uncharacterized protein LOC136083274 n=1 Tax=Hydra vulgaris TaxID=6087 RepID=A0ABM4CAP3_HYDVU